MRKLFTKIAIGLGGILIGIACIITIVNRGWWHTEDLSRAIPTLLYAVVGIGLIILGDAVDQR